MALLTSTSDTSAGNGNRRDAGGPGPPQELQAPKCFDPIDRTAWRPDELELDEIVPYV